MTSGRKLILIFGSLGLLVLIFGLSPGLAWDGGATVEFRFHIYDAAKRLPVTNATVRVIRRSILDLLSDTNLLASIESTATDAQGNATNLLRCGAGGSSGLLGKTGRINISNQMLLIEARDYFPVSVALEDVAGGNRWPLSKRSFDLNLVMFKKP